MTDKKPVVMHVDWTSYKELDDAVNRYWMLRKDVLTQKGWLKNG